MKKVTAQELATAFEETLTEVTPMDYFGMTFEMSKARIQYNEDEEELCFTAGNYNKDGIGTVVIKEESIESIEFDEESDEYVISFENAIPDVVVAKFKDLVELEQERIERKQ